LPPTSVPASFEMVLPPGDPGPYVVDLSQYAGSVLLGGMSFKAP
jgi:hypothetical protein